MARFDTTATVTADATLNLAANPNTNGGTLSTNVISGSLYQESVISNFRLPDQPVGADSINQLRLVLTYKEKTIGASVSMDIAAKKFLIQNWTESFVTYRSMATNVQWPNGTASGSTSTLLSFQTVTPGSIASFAWDITGLNLTWGDHGSVYLTRSTNLNLGRNVFFSDDYSTSTTAFRPHIVVTFTDNPPLAINDLTVVPDTSLSEASYTFRQRALLKWAASEADDFERYRIRFGVNRSLAANHTHKAFVSSRASNSFLDTTLYTGSSTIYYSVYVEDTRNQSASTNTNVSNIVSWQKPDAIVGSVSIGSSASTLQE